MSSRIKPVKPYPDFPLYAHASGRWAKKIKGKLHYFGPWEDWPAALAKFQQEKDDLYAGRTPLQGAKMEYTLGEACVKFLKAKSREVEPVTYAGYRTAVRSISRFIPPDTPISEITQSMFAGAKSGMLQSLSPTTVTTHITVVKTMFNYAKEAGWIAAIPNYGPGFKKPSYRDRRLATQERLIEARHIRRLIRHSPPVTRAMLFLGINCAFGNEDCAAVPISAFDLDQGWVNFPRPKTGAPRRCPLWRSTLDAVKEALRVRPVPASREWADLAFLTSRGGRWAQTAGRSQLAGYVHRKTKALGIYQKGIGFYSFRHTFRTVADASLDVTAMNLIMGHSDNSIQGVYRHGIADERLIAVTEIVANWLLRRDGAAQAIWPLPPRSIACNGQPSRRQP